MMPSRSPFTRPVAALCLATFTLCASAEKPDPLGAIAALAKLTPGLARDVVKVSGDNGNPNPGSWYIQTRDRNDANRQIRVIVTNGRIEEQKPRMDFRQAIAPSTAIDISEVRIDSGAVFEIARKYAEANGRQLGMVSYVLAQESRGASPIWSAWCYDPDENYFGMIRILAANGGILLTEDLPNKPAP